INLLFFATVIAVYTHPVHFPSIDYFFLTNYRDIIFNITSYYASTATYTRVKVNGHSPMVINHVMFVPDAYMFWIFWTFRSMDFLSVSSGIWVLYILFKNAFLYYRTAHDSMMCLCLRYLIELASRFYIYVCSYIAKCTIF